MRGIIATDIDRTLTNKEHKIPKEVMAHLKKCHGKGFEIVFLTGRPYSFSKQVLEGCDFPFHLGVQNGAEILKMPDVEFKMQSFISRDEMRAIRETCHFEDRDFILYSGISFGDSSYYEAKKFSGFGRKYLDYYTKMAVVNWKDVDCLNSIESDGFPLMRMFGTRVEMELLKERIEKVADVICVVLNDVVIDDTCVLMVTAKNVDKGQSLKRLIEHYGWSGHVIGCGDDLNDVPLFEAVDISIGMENGHPHLLKNATILAKPAYEMGIIAALDKAIEMTNG